MGWGTVIGAAGGLIGGLLASESSRDTAQSAQYAAQLQWDIANRVQAIADEMQGIWRQYYMRMEVDLNDEIQALPPYQVQYATAANRAIVEVRKQFGLARRKTLECMDIHCVGAAISTVRDMATGEALAAGWAATLMIRGEDAMKRSVDHQQRQEQLAIAQFAHKAYFSTDGTMLAAKIAQGLQTSAAQSASNQAGAAGYMITSGLRSLFGEGGVFSDKKNPNPQTSQTSAGVQVQPAGTNATQRLFEAPASDDTGRSANPFDTPIASVDTFTIDNQA